MTPHRNLWYLFAALVDRTAVHPHVGPVVLQPVALVALQLVAHVALQPAVRVAQLAHFQQSPPVLNQLPFRYANHHVHRRLTYQDVCQFASQYHRHVFRCRILVEHRTRNNLACLVTHRK